MLDWTRLRSYQEDPPASFEELCYQVARVEYGHLGRFLSIDDSGGGDGVEFYLTLPNGDQWGWQAKFYPGARLNASRRGKIESSLKKAVAVHGTRLKKFFLCLPINLVKKGENSETKWWEEDLPALAPDVEEFVLWGASELFALLQQPGMEGIRHCFFGDLVLRPEWFEARLEEQLANVRDKYDAALHTETESDLAVQALAGTTQFQEALRRAAYEMDEATAALRGALHMLTQETVPSSSPDPTEGDSPSREHTSLSDISDRLGALRGVEEAADRMRSSLEGVRVDAGQGDVTETQKRIAEAEPPFLAFREALDAYYRFSRPDDDLPDRVFDALNAADQALEALGRAARVRGTMAYLRIGDLHAIGDAGVGKTHLSCHIVQSIVRSGGPALLFLGGQFSRSADPQSRILSQLGVPAAYGWDDLLAALDAYANARRMRGLIVIDALNEAQTPEVWRQHLPGLIASIRRYPRLALLTTCRPIYREPIWGPKGPEHVITARGFSRYDVRQAVAKYFARYKLRADLTLASLEPFQLPIYLSLFCRAKNEAAEVERDVVIGQQTLYEVFDEYLAHANDLIRARLNRGVRSIVEPKLRLLAGLLWERRARVVSFEEVCIVLDQQSPDDLEWDSSLTHAVLDEGLLLRRDVSPGSLDEVVAFSYDLFAGYLIAKQLVSGKTREQAEALVRSPDFIERVAASTYAERHPLHEDILRGLAAVLPKQVDAHLYQLADNPLIYSYGISSLFDASARQVTTADAAEVRRLAERSHENVSVFTHLSSQTAFNPSHALNATFFSDLLAGMSVPERDLSWTEVVRERPDRWLGEVEEFERTCQATPAAADSLVRARLRLGARRYQWLLTSTHRLLRDLATRALYWHGRRDPEDLFGLTLSSLEINDPYVRERLLAASYGVVMALHADPERGAGVRAALPAYAAKLYGAMFAPSAPHGTTHALIRDYARCTITLALRHHSDLLSSEEAARIQPPFTTGGIREWGESEDRDAGKYRHGNDPLGLDFENYTIGRLVPGRGNYDSEHPEFQRVLRQMWWRIYQLGYSLDRFGEIDQQIARRSFSRHENNADRIDRYGKKYAWIAYYEQYGLREDEGVLHEEEEFAWRDPRPSDVDIDPSFPKRGEEVSVVSEDLLGDRTVPLETWIEQGPGPDLGPYLVLEEIAGEEGPWVLLDGYISQEDRAADRTFFVFPRGLLVRDVEREVFSSRLSSQNLGGRWLPEIPQDHYLFAGEIPWSPHFPYNGWRRIRFGSPRAEPFDPETYDHEVLLPVRDFSWESYHSGANESGGEYVPAREIAEPLGLWIRLPSWDFYDPAGRCVTRFVSSGSALNGRQRLLYIRRDSLDQVLIEQELALVWGVWGERRVADVEDGVPLKVNRRRYAVHQRVYKYGDGAAHPVDATTEVTDSGDGTQGKNAG